MSERSLKPKKSPKIPLSSSQFPKMPRKSLLKPTLATLLSLLSFYAFFITFLSPNPNPNFIPSSSSSSSSSSVSAKIYVYDLPRKFTYGVIDSYLAARGGSGSVKPPVKYPGHQHSAEWWLFSDLIRPDRIHSGGVERVSDPEDADLFYVPFFSSLSLVVKPIRPGGLGNGGIYSDEEMQEELVEWLEGQVYWRRNLGRDHVFVCQDPNALYRVVDRVRNAVLLVSDFGRLRGDQASLVKDVILPYSHRINSYNGEVGVEKRNSLLFFMGNRFRKEVMF